MGTTMLTVGSLFAGIGSIELGLERTGHFETKWQVEIDEYATRVLAKHWPNVRRWEDITTFPPDDGEWQVDLICGGFPCQPVSVAGQQRGSDDERWLWPEFARVVQSLQPKYVLVENVPGLLSANAGRLFGGILRDLATLGLDAEWDCIRTGLHRGHKRSRVFLVAYPDSQGLEGTRKRGEAEGATPSVFIQSAATSLPRPQPAPNVVRGVSGIPNRTHRLRCLGNAVVPQVAEWLGHRIWEIHTNFNSE